MADNYVNINVAVQVNQAIQNLTQLQSTINQMAARSTQSINATNSALSRFSSGLSGAFSGIASQLNPMGLQLRGITANLIALGFAVKETGERFKEFFNRAADMELFRTRMTTLAGGVNQANEQINQVFELAKRVPFSLDSITDSFTRMKSAGIEPIVDASGNGPLKTMMDAFASFGATSDEFQRGIYAITQMAGKGVVSMEELRQQLGEAMPTAMRIAAKSMGMTVGEFVNQVSKGQITFDAFFDKFVAATQKIYGGNAEKFVNTFRGAWAQLETAMSRVADQMLNNSGLMSKFTALVQLATQRLYQFIHYLDTPAGAAWLDSLWTGFEKVAQWIGEAIVPAQNLITILGNIASAAAQVTGSLPAEIVGGGILGYILFGAKGAALGGAFAMFSEQLANSSGAISAFVSTVQGIFSGAGWSSTVAGGLLGFYIAGLPGALAGAAIAAMTDAQSAIFQFVDNIAKKWYSFLAFIKTSVTNMFSDQDTFNKAWDQNAKDMWNFVHSLGNDGVGGLVAPDPNAKTSIPGYLKATGDSMDYVANKAQGNKNAINDFFNNLNKQAQAVQDSKVTDPLSSLPEQLHKDLDQVNVELGNGQKRVFDNQRSALEALLSSINEGKSRLAEADKQIDAAMQAGDAAGQKKWEDYRVQLYNTVNTYVEQAHKLGEVKLTNVADQFDQLKNKVQEFATSIPNSFEKQATLQKSLGDLRTQIDEYKTSLDKANLTDQQRATITAHLAELDQEYAAAEKLVADHVDDAPWVKQAKAKKSAADATDKLAQAEARSNNAAAQAQTQIESLTKSVDDMLGSAGMDNEAAKVQQKSDEIDKLLAQIQQEIVKIQGLSATGVLSPDAAQADIAKLDAIQQKLEQNRSAIIDSVTASGQAWKDFMTTVNQSMTTAISDGLYGLVTGTKSAKEVLLDFYNAITRAVTDYLAKQIMVGIFGGGGVGSGGGLLGGLLGFASGGSFMVDGRGGIDQNIVAFKASKGERVSIQTKEQQAMGGGGDTFIIHAVDAKSVAELFMTHGSALQSALNQRTRLNHR